MKLFTTLAIPLLAFFLCAQKTFGDSLSAGDIVIDSNDKNGNFYCDGLICPENTYSCNVTKRNDPKDSKQIVRTRMCVSEDGTILKNEVVREPNKFQGTVNAHAFALGNSGGYALPLDQEQQMFGPYPPYMPSGFGNNWFP